MFAEFLMAAGLCVGAPADCPQVNQAIPQAENRVKIELVDGRDPDRRSDCDQFFCDNFCG
jgi:hypothetical protein